jgi:hypothetical protein
VSNPYSRDERPYRYGDDPPPPLVGHNPYTDPPVPVNSRVPQPLPPMHAAPQRIPGVGWTAVITFFFGIFGLIPAILHSNRAARAGASRTPYWVTFAVVVVISYVVGYIWLYSNLALRY